MLLAANLDRYLIASFFNLINLLPKFPLAVPLLEYSDFSKERLKEM